MWKSQGCRRIHTTAKRGDFFSWFKSKKDEVKDTKDVIKQVEAGKTALTDNKNKTKLKLIPSNFIGEDSVTVHKRTQDARVDSVAFNKWLSRNKVTTEQQLDAALQESLQVATTGTTTSLNDPFQDLVTKFQFTKSLQARTGYIVPDYAITTAATPLELKDYFVREVLSGKLAKFKESEPNAIDLSNKDYGSPNVHVVVDINIRKQNRERGAIIQQVHALELENLRRHVEEAKRE